MKKMKGHYIAIVAIAIVADMSSMTLHACQPAEASVRNLAATRHFAAAVALFHSYAFLLPCFSNAFTSTPSSFFYRRRPAVII